MLISIFAFLMLIAGIVVWVISSNPKVMEIGRQMMFCGFFFVTWVLCKTVLKIP
jgi:Na+/phosphate symporter